MLEIDDDVVSVMDGRKLAARFREVEVEVVGPASAALLDGVVYRLAEAGAVPGDGRAKLARAIGPRAAEAPDVSPVPIDRDSSMAEVIRAAISHGYLRLVAHDPGIRLDEDPEDVHQARVATRRLRSDLRSFRAFLPADWNIKTRDELGWLANALGRTRDADVLLERLHGQMESLEARDAAAAGAIISRLVDERLRARDGLLGALNSDRYGRLLDRLTAAARELPPMKVAEEPVVAAMVVPWPAESVTSVAAAPVPVEVNDSPAENDAVPSAPAPALQVPVVAADPTGPAATAVVAGPARVVSLPAPEPPVAGPGYPTSPLPPASPSPPPDRDSLARKVAPSVVAKPWKHLARSVADLGPSPDDDALHEVRIRAKRLRYACEAVAGVAGRPATCMARAAADLQGVLGDFHDAIVAADWLREASAGATLPQALAAGQLIGMERQDASRCREAWADAWDRLDRKKLRKWLR
jgi:CHAD domain-containing protein